MPSAPCEPQQFAGSYEVGPDGKASCRLPIVRETLPNGVSYDTIDMGYSEGDDFGPLIIAPDHVFLMGDNRDRSADSRLSLEKAGLGGPVPFENIGGRAEFITFSLNGTTGLNPTTWLSSFRSGRAGNSLRSKPAKVRPYWRRGRAEPMRCGSNSPAPRNSATQRWFPKFKRPRSGSAWRSQSSV